MEKVRNYIDNLMINNSLTTENSVTSFYEDNAVLIGGNKKDTNVPTGGFPPIFMCDTNKKSESPFEEDSEKIKLEYKTHKKAVSIKDIMTKRRDVKPFITLS